MRGKLEICPVRGKIRNFPCLQIKFLVRTKETDAIMVLIFLNNIEACHVNNHSRVPKMTLQNKERLGLKIANDFFTS